MDLYTFLPKREKYQAIAVVSVVVLTLAAAFFYEGVTLHSRTIEEVITKKEKSIDSTVKDITLYSFTPYEQRLANLLATHEGIPKAFLDQDRDTLYKLSRPLYEALKSENKQLHVMHFHRPDGSSFLRMHKPEKYGDDLREVRPAVQNVHQKRTPLACYEIGIYGTFYRIIQPVFHQGAYAGAVELGIKVHSILESLQKEIPDPLTTFFIADRWQKVTKPLKYEHLDFGIYTLNTHNDPLYKQLPADLDLSRDNQRLTINGNPYLVHTYPVFRDFQGAPIGGFMVLQDISQALAAKKTFVYRSLSFAALLLLIALAVLYLSFGKLIDKLEGSRSSWERTFDAIGDIVTIMNSRLQILKANKAAYAMLNAEPGSLTGKFCYEVFSNRSSACEGCPGLDTLDKCQTGSAEVEHQNLHKKFLITTSPVPDEKGAFTNIVHIAKDITQKKDLESQLRQAQKMQAIGTLAGGIAHDFNNILTAISGYNKLALQKAGDNDTITHDLQQVMTATARAKDLVTQILTFSRQSEDDKKPIEISPIVKEALQLVRSSFPRTIELKQRITSDGNILADPTQIHQIAMNLATNAYHAMLETGGILSVSLQEEVIIEKSLVAELEVTPGRYICLEVSDTGCGMDKDTKEKIFDPYFTTKEVDKGTGLGLAVVHGIVTGHHGHIHVDSEPGHGTTFRIYLPMVEEEPVAYPPQTDEEPVRGGSERIMIIDDEEIIAHLASEVLRTYGYDTEIFTNGVQAMQDFEKHRDKYDLVISDMSMPYMTGLQLSQKIKEMRPDLPIILCSGYSEKLYKEKALAMGISRYIQKPLDMDNLARVIRQLLDRDSQ